MTTSSECLTAQSFHRLTLHAPTFGRLASPCSGGRVRGRAVPMLLTAAYMVMIVFGAALPGRAATLTVTDTTDNASDPGSLRYALANAQNGDTITFSLPNPSTIALTPGAESNLNIATNVTIIGPGPAALAIVAPGINSLPYCFESGCSTGVFRVSTGVTATISGVTITNGADVVGGGILNYGTLTVTNCIVSGNNAIYFGEGIFNFEGTLTVIDSIVSNNGVYEYEYLGPLQTQGGGIANSEGTVTVINSTISGNIIGGLKGSFGGGINNGGTMTVINSTISGNTAYGNLGGGIFNGGTLTIINGTLFGNSAEEGAGIWDTGTVMLKGTLLVGNTTEDQGLGNCTTAYGERPNVSLGYNLDDDGSCGLNQPSDQSDVANAASFLGPLQSNGGLTSTIALLPGSTAIDAIPVNVCTDASGNPVAADQRGTTRPQGAGCDIGAYEVATPPQVANLCGGGQSSPAPCYFPIVLNFYVPSGTTLGPNPAQVLTQGVAGLDFSLYNTNCGSLSGPATCTVNVTFVPLAPGVRPGAVNLTDSSGNLVASHPIYATGQGPAVAYAPGTQTNIFVNAGGIGLNLPYGVAVDAAGDVFFADYGNYRVVKLPAGGGPQTTVASGVLNPTGVAVDGAGDVLFADVLKNQVMEVPRVSNGAYGTPTALASGLSSPFGVAVDGAGDVFIADTGNNRVVEVAAGCTGAACQTTVATGLNQPLGVTVDGAGDVLIADTNNNRVLEVPAGCTTTACQTTIGSGLSLPDGVAVDAAGDVFITNGGFGDVVQVPVGCTTADCQTTVGTGQFSPVGIAVDGAGDVFIADTFNNRAFEVNRSQPPSLSFSYTDNTIDSPQSVTLQSIGDQPLNLASFAASNNFQVGSGTCSAASSLAPGASCMVSVACSAASSGSFNGKLTFTDNAFNLSPGTQQVPLSCIASQASQTITFTLPASVQALTSLALTGSATSSLPVAYTSSTPSVCSVSGATAQFLTSGLCTISASQAGNSLYLAATPVPASTMVSAVSQSITFTGLPATATYGAAGPYSLNATSTSGGTPTYSFTGPASITGSTLTITGAGTVTVTAAFAATTIYTAASASQTIIVSAPTYDTAITVQFSSTTLVYPGATEITVCIAPAHNVTATGSVQLFDGTTLLTTQTLGGGGCAYWYISPGLAAGTHTISAVYSGDKNNSGGASAPTKILVSPVPVILGASCWNASFAYGGNYQCTVSASSNAGSAQGVITYSVDGRTPAVSVPVSNGNAQFTVTKPLVGAHSVTIAYAQQGNYAAASAPTQSFTVTPAPVVVALTPSSYYTSASTGVTFQAAVSSWSAGAPDAIGAVSFYDGSKLLATLPVNASGQASYFTNTLSVGSHTITATYAGTNYAAGSASATIKLIP